MNQRILHGKAHRFRLLRQDQDFRVAIPPGFLRLRHDQALKALQPTLERLKQRRVVLKRIVQLRKLLQQPFDHRQKAFVRIFFLRAAAALQTCQSEQLGIGLPCSQPRISKQH
ncbi:hypothetical protein DJ90_6331 [Paenibacillus macerans]|uniref:Uncharacterized protein n=1 Tax=Paenibacillus macerans TaxID=44252 RepID=A0A090Y973_PAEMA|nr:hypothetical protein DJ90_6331 [Paenibacillus macerans]